MATRYYICDRAHHVSEVDLRKWERWIEKGHRATKQDWVSMTVVSTAFLGRNHICDDRQPGFWECAVFGIDDAETQYCDDNLEQAMAMHARMLASVRLLCRQREAAEQESEAIHAKSLGLRR